LSRRALRTACWICRSCSLSISSMFTPGGINGPEYWILFFLAPFAWIYIVENLLAYHCNKSQTIQDPFHLEYLTRRTLKKTEVSYKTYSPKKYLTRQNQTVISSPKVS
jgi:hypothetical protein